ncbi:MAG: hypothetical protein ACYDBQ_10475 [Thermoplasmatota archaeon]
MRVLLGLAAVFVLLGPAAASNCTYGGTKPLFSVVDRSTLDGVTGGNVTFSTRLENHYLASPELTMYVSIVDAQTGVPIDLRNWVAANGSLEARAQQIPSLAENATSSQSWTLNTPISGNFLVYVITLDRHPDPVRACVQPFSTPPLHLHVALKTNLDPGGILPVALGVPAALGVWMAAIRRRTT